jgi:hypothetical protein
VAGRVYAWDSVPNTYGTESEHSADRYIFCLYDEKIDRRLAVLLDMNRWKFYVVPTEK